MGAGAGWGRFSGRDGTGTGAGDSPWSEEWYSTESAVSSMKTSSSEARSGVSSCSVSAALAASSPTSAADTSVTMIAPSSPTVGRAPARDSVATKRWGVGVTMRTASVLFSAVNSSTVVSAISRPRPMTTRRSAVRAISLMRWLETRTVRPSAARSRSRWRTQRMPSGSSPLTGSSKRRTPGSPNSALAMPRRCPMPRENLPARLSATEVNPTISRTSSTRRSGMSLVWASAMRWLRALRPGWKALASSSAPTSRSGQRSSA